MNTCKIMSSSMEDPSFDHSQTDTYTWRYLTPTEAIKLESETSIRLPKSVCKIPKHRPPYALEEIVGPMIICLKAWDRPHEPEDQDDPTLDFSKYFWQHLLRIQFCHCKFSLIDVYL
jgi:hypothetical protein